MFLLALGRRSKTSSDNNQLIAEKLYSDVIWTKRELLS